MHENSVQRSWCTDLSASELLLSSSVATRQCIHIEAHIHSTAGRPDHGTSLIENEPTLRVCFTSGGCCFCLKIRRNNNVSAHSHSVVVVQPHHRYRVDEVMPFDILQDASIGARRYVSSRPALTAPRRDSPVQSLSFRLEPQRKPVPGTLLLASLSLNINHERQRCASFRISR